VRRDCSVSFLDGGGMVRMEVQVVSTDEGGVCRDCIGDVEIEI
jgi:hypothetical protein